MEISEKSDLCTTTNLTKFNYNSHFIEGYVQAKTSLGMIGTSDCGNPLLNMERRPFMGMNIIMF
jgi:hypothetical protein